CGPGGDASGVARSGPTASSRTLRGVAGGHRAEPLPSLVAAATARDVVLGGACRRAPLPRTDRGDAGSRGCGGRGRGRRSGTWGGGNAPGGTTDGGDPPLPGGVDAGGDGGSARHRDWGGQDPPAQGAGGAEGAIRRTAGGGHGREADATETDQDDGRDGGTRGRAANRARGRRARRGGGGRARTGRLRGDAGG